MEVPPQPVIKKQDPPKQEAPSLAHEPAFDQSGASSAEDDIELEETVHDYDKMIAMSVIEAEIELMQSLIKAAT